MRRVALVIFAFLFFISTPISALSTKESFRSQNDVLYYDDCSGGSSAGSSESSKTKYKDDGSTWVFPVQAGTPITSEFHEDRGYAHRGVDLGAPMGSPIFASRAGKVIAAGPASGFGNWIVIQHEVDGKRVDSVYGHMTAASIKVKTGDTVTAGQRIASVGSEGESSGAHLHYEEWNGPREGFGSGGSERKPEAVYGKNATVPSDNVEDATTEADTTTPSTCCGSTGSAGEGAAAVAGSGGGGGCGEQGYASGKQGSKANKDQIWSFFKSKGLSDIAVAGIMGNIEQESAFMPDAVNSLGCTGIVQWCFGRNDNMRAFAQKQGKDFSCLGSQLEFVWYEVTQTGESGVMKNLNAAKTPYDAGNVWAVEYERMKPSEQAGRADRAEALYKEYTGKDASALSDSSSAASCASSDTGGAIPSPECAALVEQYKKLRGSGKMKETDGASIDQDLKNCTTGQIQCGTPGGSGGGVNPFLLRAVIAAIENSGSGELEVWNMNTRHPCDGLNHPNGKASDIVCRGNTMGQKTATDKCNAIFKYLYDNYEELKLSELIWQYPPPPYSCTDKKIMCYVDGHDDHIHVGVSP